MAGARRVHVEAREIAGVHLPAGVLFRYVGVSICGRYERKHDHDEHLRRRLTSAVNCQKCRRRWLKLGTAAPPEKAA